MRRKDATIFNDFLAQELLSLWCNFLAASAALPRHIDPHFLVLDALILDQH
jgi:hypothetical protein